MRKIAIITDTDSSLPPTIAEKHHIYQVPITIHFDNENFTTGVDIDDKHVFELIDQYKKLPTTSAPPPAAFEKAYQKAFDQGADAIICICVSSNMSSTYQSAANALLAFPDKEIKVVDSLNISMGQGFMTLAAAEAAATGAGVAEILAVIDNVGKRLHTFGALTTLKYLAMSGRVGKIAAGMADTLDIKPVLTIVDGKLQMLEKVRTNKKAQERVLELLKFSLTDKPIEKAAVTHVNNPEAAGYMVEQLRERFSITSEISVVEFTPGLSVHTGSGLVALIGLAAE